MSQSSHWHVKNIGDALLAGDELAHIKMLFQRAHLDNPSSQEMAIFIRHESDGQLHCDVRLYFSPASAALARELSAIPCAPPSATDLGLFAGPETAWTLFKQDK